MIQWVYKLYEKLVKNDAAIQQRPIEKASNEKMDKVLGPLFK